jgi:uncharacterized protein
MRFTPLHRATLVFICLVFLPFGCNGGASSNGSMGSGAGPKVTITSVSVSCEPSSIRVNQNSKCSANVTGTGTFDPSITWSVDSGTIDQSGNYTAPASATMPSVKATSVQNLLKSGTASITVNQASASPQSAALNQAAIDGDVPMVRRLIAGGADVNGRGSGGWTPLMSAANNAHVEVAKVLLAKGADVNAACDNGHTALMSIAEGVGIGEVLLAAGANVNAQRRDGMTALMIAVVNDNTPLVKALLTEGADVSAQMPANGEMFSGWTASNFAEWKGEAVISRLLANHVGQTAASPNRDGSQSSPEIRMTDYLLKSPAGLSKPLGKIVRRTECVDSDGKQIEYERGYVCTQGGRVVLLSYDLQRSISSPEAALQAVGLTMSVKPQELGVAYMWLKARGNALPVGNRLATRVMVTLGQTPNVTVNLGDE